MCSTTIILANVITLHLGNDTVINDVFSNNNTKTTNRANRNVRNEL